MPDHSPCVPEVTQTENLINPDGSMNSTELQRCVDMISQRAQDVLIALQKIFEKAGPSQMRTCQICIQIGIEIGALLRDIPAFQRALESISHDSLALMTASNLDGFVAPLHMALDACGVVLNDDAEAEGSADEADTSVS